jgi:3D (Asp-Asp-Asp) domain-containing protein
MESTTVCREAGQGRADRGWRPAALHRLRLLVLLVGPALSCTTRGAGDWVTDVPEVEPVSGDVQPLTSAAPRSASSAEPTPPEMDGGVEEPVMIKEHGRPGASPPRKPSPGPSSSLPGATGVFRNTYYDFPSEGGGRKDATLYDARCSPLAAVTRQFHDDVCVQGSGRIASGATVSFARRDCECAALCPRTSQKICFDKLDAARFPHGRGAMGGPITPLRTVAVDSSVIPLGTVIFVPELAGLPRQNGTRHDGCFIAEDRGVKVVGKQIDVFTGDPSMTARWNTLFPSNRGVHVRPNDPRCASLSGS